MAVVDVETGAMVVRDEELEVLCWRVENLVRAGYDVDTAAALAADAGVDLHNAVDLLACGCSEPTALRILLSHAPLLPTSESTMRHATPTPIRG